MINFKTTLLVGAAALLTACATATPYQAANTSGYSGYSQTQIESNRFNVSFSGNSLTDRETVETYLLFRAAEIAVENGFDYFTVVEKETDKKTRLIGSPSGFSGAYGRPFYAGFSPHYDFYHPRFGWRSAYRPIGFRRGFYGHRRGFYDPFYDPFWDARDYREVTKFTANAQVIMGRGAKPNEDRAFNAKEVMQNLSPKVIYPEEKT